MREGPDLSPGPLARGASDHVGRLCVFGLATGPASSPVPGRPVRDSRGCGGSPAGGRTPRFPLALRPEGSRVRGLTWHQEAGISCSSPLL